jgi:2-amino-4-hydroxy-6-hydroxymethyldihydropteridine diphosphokinase
VVALSPFHETAPEGFRRQPDFVNAVVRIRTPLAPRELLDRVKEIERVLGRTPSFRNGPRVIDIDLLDVRSEVLRSRELVLPHPRMHRRRFVLEPLAEIAPRWRHPVSKKSARRLLREL